MVKESKDMSARQQKDVIMTVALIVIVILINFIGAFLFKRFDLTAEKRFTLAESTRKLVQNVKEEMLFKVYLEGNFNPNFTRLRNEAKEMLDQFRFYSNNNIQYEFIDPASEDLRPGERDSVQAQLFHKGIQPYEDFKLRGDKSTSMVIWPGAVVSYKEREMVWQIFNRQEVGMSQEMNINNSVNDLEFTLCNVIRLLQRDKKPEVTFIDGHHETDTIHRIEFMRALSEYYTVNRTRFRPGAELSTLRGSDAIVIQKPDTSFSDKEIFAIDQYIMKGGKVLWLIDPVSINYDTLMLKGYSLGLNRPLNIEDMLFTYGVRINPVLLQDMQCNVIALNAGFKNGQANYKKFPWLYSLQVVPPGTHPITKNLDVLKMDYVSQIDTISAKNVKKTILLTSSRNTKIQQTPARIFFASAAYPVKESLFKDKFVPVAVLLEGTFKSFLEHKYLPLSLQNNPDFPVLSSSKPTKMIVVADGDMAGNEIQARTGRPYPLGYDIFSKATFGNRSFLLNCVNYLLDDEGMLQLRAREVKLRLLDKKKIKQQRSKWQTVNVGIPLGLILLFAAAFKYFRERRYARN